jgi:hypothetical protein
MNRSGASPRVLTLHRIAQVGRVLLIRAQNVAHQLGLEKIRQLTSGFMAIAAQIIFSQAFDLTS